MPPARWSDAPIVALLGTKFVVEYEGNQVEDDMKSIKEISLRAQQTLLGSLAARCSYKLLKRA